MLHDDLYAAAVEVIVDGTLDGDLVAFAAERVVINGTVTGSVTAVTPNVTIEGEVEGSVRVAAGRLTVGGVVGGDIVATAVNADLDPASVVSGDVIVWAWHARSAGHVGGDLTGTQRALEIAGTVTGDVDVSVTRLTVVDSLDVGGDFGYRSEAEAIGIELVSADGAIVHRTPLPPNLRVRALLMFSRVLAVLMLSLAALTVAYGWPQRTTNAIRAMGRSPVKRWLAGAPIVFSPLILLALTALILRVAPATAAFPLLAVLVPLIIAVTGVILTLCFVAGVPVVGWLGGVLFRKLDFYGAILAGSVIAGVVWHLPFVGWLVPAIVLPLGLGGWLAGSRDQQVDEPAPS